MISRLEQIVKEYIDSGYSDKSSSLGIQTMPDGYALMLDPDGMYFFWLREDGVESSIHWDKWCVYLGAKEDKTDED